MAGGGRSIDPEAYKKRLRLMREILVGGNQQKFADKLGIPMKRWNNFERGLPISREVAFMILEKFDEVSVEWLWFGMPGNLRGEFKKKVEAAEAYEKERDLAYTELKKAQQRVKAIDALRAKKLHPAR